MSQTKLAHTLQLIYCRERYKITNLVVTEVIQKITLSRPTTATTMKHDVEKRRKEEEEKRPIRRLLRQAGDRCL